MAKDLFEESQESLWEQLISIERAKPGVECKFSRHEKQIKILIAAILNLLTRSLDNLLLWSAKQYTANNIVSGLEMSLISGNVE